MTHDPRIPPLFRSSWGLIVFPECTLFLLTWLIFFDGPSWGRKVETILYKSSELCLVILMQFLFIGVWVGHPTLFAVFFDL